MQYFMPTEHQVESSSSARIEKKAWNQRVLFSLLFSLYFYFFVHPSHEAQEASNFRTLTPSFFKLKYGYLVFVFAIFPSKKENDQTLFPPGLEPRTFRVLGGRDNHYTTETRHTTSNHVYCFFISSVQFTVCSRSAVHGCSELERPNRRFEGPQQAQSRNMLAAAFHLVLFDSVDGRRMMADNLKLGSQALAVTSIIFRLVLYFLVWIWRVIMFALLARSFPGLSVQLDAFVRTGVKRRA